MARYSMVGDWKKAGTRYVRINKKLPKHSYNQDEMAEIGRLQGECMNSFKNAMSDKIEGAANLLKGLTGSGASSSNEDDVMS